MHASKALAQHAYAGDASIVVHISVEYKRCWYVDIHRGGRYM